jgi:hypothetical protein
VPNSIAQAPTAALLKNAAAAQALTSAARLALGHGTTLHSFA